jgi:hypothetical protein
MCWGWRLGFVDVSSSGWRGQAGRAEKFGRHPADGGEDRQTGVIIADGEWFHVFSYQWLAGNPAVALKESYQVVLTVSYQSIRAAMANPVESLKTE